MRGPIARSKRVFGGRKLNGRRENFRLAACLSLAGAALLAMTAGTQNAAANGETRTLTFFHTHTQESTTVTFRRDGQYDEQALAQLNWFLRDWRVNKPTKMDPRLFDILWEVYRESGSTQPINIISAYRSPETNSALRRRSSGVSEHSQHMLGKAMDVRLPDVSTEKLRAIAMKMQYGGVGYYSSSAFVHVDTGNVRAWPRMSQDQLARLFPDGKTLHLPPSGKPLPGYEQAKAEILPRNAALASLASAGGGPSVSGLVAKLFGRKDQQNTTLAYAAPEGMDTAKTWAPVSPPRPQEASLPVQSLAAGAAPVLGYDEKSAVRALFEPRTSIAGFGFSSGQLDDLSTTRFTGPAVRPLPLVREAQASL